MAFPKHTSDTEGQGKDNYAYSLDEQIERLDIRLSSLQRQRLLKFGQLCDDWSEHTSLFAGNSQRARAEILFLDALAISKHQLLGKAQSLVDVGAGGGAPSIPLACLYPDIDILLVEPRRKRVAFLRFCIGALEFAARVRVMDIGIDPKHPLKHMEGRFDVALSRATFSPEQWQRIGKHMATRTLVFGTQPVASVPSTNSYRYDVPSTGAIRYITTVSSD